jgi:hypothetical protein
MQTFEIITCEQGPDDPVHAYNRTLHFKDETQEGAMNQFYEWLKWKILETGATILFMSIESVE